jgi:class 3 adenylate cyclase/tetratricopeptide (TPR) repeat protein
MHCWRLPASKLKVYMVMTAEQRRIITILFSDIVGSTPIAEQLDPEDWREIVEQVHTLAGEIVLSHQGQVLQYLGDGMLAVFGAESASERDPERAIQAALELVRKVPHLPTQPIVKLRIAVHTGLVVLGELGGEAKRELTASGDAMNTAQRLQSLAEPETVLISHETYRYVRGLFDVVKQEPQTVRGRQGMIQPYRVMRYKQHPIRMVTRGVGGVKTSTVGRNDEMLQLNKHLHDMLEQDLLLWVQMIGDPGMGKTRMLSDMGEALDQVPEELCILRSQALDGDDHRPYTFIRRLWLDHFHITEDAPAEEAEEYWIDQFHESIGPGHTLETLALGLLVGLHFGDHPSIGILHNQPSSIKPLALTASKLIVESVKMHKPTVLLLEDLQWTDHASWDYLMQVFFGQTVLDSHGRGVLILATTRPEWSPPEELIHHPSYKSIQLSPLTYLKTEELLSQLLQHCEELPKEVQSSIVQRAEGIPYFLEEIINWLIDLGALYIQQDPWRFLPDRFKADLLPETLHHLLSTRLNALEEKQKRILQAGAIFGRNFWLGGLHKIGAEADVTTLERLEQRGFIQPSLPASFSSEQEWRFHHNLMQSVAYESVLKRHRPSYHRAAAGWLEQRAAEANRTAEFVGMIGDHYERAGETLIAIDWYLQYDEVLSKLGEVAQRRELLDRMNRLVQTTKDRKKESMVLYHRGSFLHSLGKYDQSLVYLSQSLEAIEPGEDPHLESLVLAYMVPNQLRLGQYEAAEKSARQALDLIQGLDDPATVARVLTNVAMYYAENGDIERAINLYQRQIEINQSMGEAYGEAIGRMNLGYLYLHLGLYERGQDSLEQAAKIFEKIQARRMYAYSMLNIGLASCRAGQPDRAVTLINEQAYPEFETSGDRYAMGVAHCYLGLCHEVMDQLVPAKEAYQNAHAILSEINVLGPAMDALAGIMRCELTLGEVEDMIRDNERLWRFLREQGTQGMEFPIMAYQACGHAFERNGEPQKAKNVWKEGYEQLMTKAERINDKHWRESFLENIPEHREAILRKPQ